MKVKRRKLNALSFSTSPDKSRESPPVCHRYSVPSKREHRAQATLRAHKHSRLDWGGIQDDESGGFVPAERKWKAKRVQIRIRSWPDVGGDTRPANLLFIRDSK